MLYYTETGLSHAEVPGESSLCIYISGCLFHCKNCHYPELQLPNYGMPLKEHYKNLIALYQMQATCVCFLGEGANTTTEHEEFETYVRYSKRYGLKACLYSGRDTVIEPWMRWFDYIKLGSYQEMFGPLNCASTNQRMYQKTEQGYIDITSAFWVE